MRDRYDFHRLALLSAAIALSILVAGCSRRVTWEVRGIVHDAVTGSPIGGVLITLESRPGTPPGATPALPIVTHQNGRFSFNIHAVDRTLFYEKPTWTLRLAKNGYHAESVDVSPNPERLPGETPGQVLVVISMRPRQTSPTRAAQ